MLIPTKFPLSPENGPRTPQKVTKRPPSKSITPMKEATRKVIYQNAFNNHLFCGRMPPAFPPLYFCFARRAIVVRSNLYTRSICACVRNFEYSL